jgi:hypothetical protein
VVVSCRLVAFFFYLFLFFKLKKVCYTYQGDVFFSSKMNQREESQRYVKMLLPKDILGIIESFWPKFLRGRALPIDFFLELYDKSISLCFNKSPEYQKFVERTLDLDGPKYHGLFLGEGHLPPHAPLARLEIRQRNSHTDE